MNIWYTLVCWSWLKSTVYIRVSPAATHLMGLDKWIMILSYQSILQRSFTVVKTLCAPIFIPPSRNTGNHSTFYSLCSSAFSRRSHSYRMRPFQTDVVDLIICMKVLPCLSKAWWLLSIYCWTTVHRLDRQQFIVYFSIHLLKDLSVASKFGIMNKTAIKIYAQILLWTHAFNSCR